jgi:hypothetical protein
MTASSPTPDTPVSRLLDELALCHRKLCRYTDGLSQEELDWAPSGINNPMSWILVHLTATLWVCHALTTDTRTRVDPASAGLALGSVRGIECGTARLPTPAADAPTLELDQALGAFRTALEGSGPELDRPRIFADRKLRSPWWMLTHEMGDFAYHTGQASYLRKLIAARRRRTPAGA